MTIPTLVSKIQEAHFHAKWKECYAILNNAFKMTVAENPRMVASELDNYYPTREFIDAMLSHLQVVDTCAALTSYDENLCDNREGLKDSQIKYKWSGTANAYSRYKTLSGGELNAYDFYNKAALLKNGASIYFGGLWSGITILVDVNNFQGGPNILGKDVYAISLMKGSSQQNNVYIEELGFAPFGAAGTRCMDEEAPCSLAEPSEGFGIWGCSENIGMKDANYIVQASGAGCSYKYLHEK